MDCKNEHRNNGYNLWLIKVKVDKHYTLQFSLNNLNKSTIYCFFTYHFEIDNLLLKNILKSPKQCPQLYSYSSCSSLSCQGGAGDGWKALQPDLLWAHQLLFWHLAPTRQTILQGSSTGEHSRGVPPMKGNSGSHNPAILDGNLDASQKEDPDTVVTGYRLLYCNSASGRRLCLCLPNRRFLMPQQIDFK